MRKDAPSEELVRKKGNLGEKGGADRGNRLPSAQLVSIILSNEGFDEA